MQPQNSDPSGDGRLKPDSSPSPPAGGEIIRPAQTFSPAPDRPATGPTGASPNSGLKPAADFVQPSSAVPADATHIPPVQTSAQPEPPKKRRPYKKLAVILIIILVLAAGSAAAYFGYYVPNQPQNVLAKGIENTLAAPSATTTGTIDLDASSLSTHTIYTAKIDSVNHAVDLNLNASVSGINFPVELISKSGDLYFKVGDLSTLVGLINNLGSIAGSNLQPEISKINKDVQNQWIEVDSTLIREMHLGCLTNYPATLSGSDIKALENSYQKDAFATITSHSSDTVGGNATYKYQLRIDDNKTTGFNPSSSQYVKNLQSCLNSISSSSGADQTVKNFKDNDQTPLTLWVDKKTKRVVKYQTQSTAQDKAKDNVQGAATGTIAYGPVNIQTPANAKPVLQILSDLGFTDTDTGDSGGSDSSTLSL